MRRGVEDLYWDLYWDLCASWCREFIFIPWSGSSFVSLQLGLGLSYVIGRAGTGLTLTLVVTLTLKLTVFEPVWYTHSIYLGQP